MKRKNKIKIEADKFFNQANSKIDMSAINQGAFKDSYVNVPGISWDHNPFATAKNLGVTPEMITGKSRKKK